MVMTMPQVVIAQAIAIAALPTFSAQVARGELPEMRASLAATLRGVLLLSIPATAGLILLRVPVIQVLFERGEFDAHSTTLVTWALLWYTAGLVAHSVVEIVSRSFYALHDTKTPVIASSLSMGLNVVLSLLLSEWFARRGWMPHGGLALANTIATTLEMSALLYLMRRRLGGLEGRRILSVSWKATFASGLMSLTIWGWLAGNWPRPVWGVALGGVALGSGVYVLATVLLRVEEVQGVVRFVKKRI
jgi:putative peptidoglycan lipid II flippase